jgi:hypothetical protein
LVCQEGGGLASERQQKGTLRVKNIQVEKTRLITVLEGDQDDDYEIEGHIDGDNALMWAMWEIYSCDQNGNKNSCQSQKLEMNQISVNSVKLYPTLAHFLLHCKHQLPINRGTMNSLHSRSMVDLQRYLNIMQSLLRDSLRQVSENGIYARIKVLVRPSS